MNQPFSLQPVFVFALNPRKTCGGLFSMAMSMPDSIAARLLYLVRAPSDHIHNLPATEMSTFTISTVFTQ